MLYFIVLFFKYNISSKDKNEIHKKEKPMRQGQTIIPIIKEKGKIDECLI